MNKEEFDINQELEQMRQDYAALKERFDKQQIINEQLMQNAMKKDVRRMFLSKKTVPLGAAFAILAVILSYVQGMAWWITLALIIFTVLLFPEPLQQRCLFDLAFPGGHEVRHTG